MDRFTRNVVIAGAAALVLLIVLVLAAVLVFGRNLPGRG